LHVVGTVLVSEDVKQIGCTCQIAVDEILVDLILVYPVNLSPVSTNNSSAVGVVGIYSALCDRICPSTANCDSGYGYVVVGFVLNKAGCNSWSIMASIALSKYVEGIVY